MQRARCRGRLTKVKRRGARSECNATGETFLRPSRGRSRFAAACGPRPAIAPNGHRRQPRCQPSTMTTTPARKPTRAHPDRTWSASCPTPPWQRRRRCRGNRHSRLAGHRRPGSVCPHRPNNRWSAGRNERRAAQRGGRHTGFGHGRRVRLQQGLQAASFETEAVGRCRSNGDDAVCGPCGRRRVASTVGRAKGQPLR